MLLYNSSQSRFLFAMFGEFLGRSSDPPEYLRGSFIEFRSDVCWDFPK